MDGENHCITLSSSFPSWYNLVMAIGSIVKKLVLDKAMVFLILRGGKVESF
jgi:hypothetical protein